MPRNELGHGSDPKPPSPKVMRAINALLNGEATTITDAAKHAGISREHLSRSLQKPHITNAIREMVDSRMKTVGFLKAAHTLDHLIGKAESEYVKLDAAKHALAIGGVRAAPERAHGGGAGSGLVIQINLAGGQIGAPDVQSQMLDAQRIDTPALSGRTHSLPKGAHEESEGGGG